jgi:large subunit ribosomal protein L16
VLRFGFFTKIIINITKTMILQPRKTKFRKAFRGKIHGSEFRVTKLAFGTLGIKALKSKRLKVEQIESLRKALIKKLKGKGKIWIRVFPQLSVTAKPVETRMGKGKGSVDYWCAQVNAGRVLFELAGISTALNKDILKISANKLPIPVKLIHLQKI